MLKPRSIYGESEELLNKWFKRTGKRDEIFLASKFGLVMDGLKFLGINTSAEYVKKACEASLAKLGVDHIDLCMSLGRIFQTLKLILVRLYPSCQSADADRGDNARIGRAASVSGSTQICLSSNRPQRREN